MKLQFVIEIEISQKRGSSIASEIGCMSINIGKSRRFLRCNRSCRLSSDVIGLGEARRLSLDVISLDVILC